MNHHGTRETACVLILQDIIWEVTQSCKKKQLPNRAYHDTLKKILNLLNVSATDEDIENYFGKSKPDNQGPSIYS